MKMTTPSKNNSNSQPASTQPGVNPSALSLVVSTRHNQPKTYGGSISNLATERNIVSDFNSSDLNLAADQNKSSVKSNEPKLKKVKIR